MKVWNGEAAMLKVVPSLKTKRCMIGYDEEDDTENFIGVSPSLQSLIGVIASYRVYQSTSAMAAVGIGGQLYAIILMQIGGDNRRSVCVWPTSA
jgi:hypothetical protein